jgi:arginyl-tRNA synthetase
LADAWYGAALGQILDAGDAFGGGTAAEAQRINVEFVSANPTGPLTAAGGRHAAYGDSLSRVLEFAGHEVEREYYFNDAGTQVRKLGESIRARARGEEVPEDGYEGEYVVELAQRIPGAADGDPDDLAHAGIEILMDGIRATLARYRVEFDTFFSERTLHEAQPGDPSPIDRAFAKLRESGHIYESEGALWLRTTTFGDDKDRVLVRSSGDVTYFAADVAYFEHKRDRGFDRLINVLGSDHHGYIGRLKAIAAALDDPDLYEILIMQFVHIVESGERASMSKRRGDFVTLDELLDDIGVDATRYFMLQRSHDTTMDLDLDLAREESAENPVYYVQYAHARIAGIRAKAGEQATAPSPAVEVELHPAERALILKLLAFPVEVEEAAERRAPHRIATYALELAQEFTAFYRDCKVVGADPPAAEAFRLALCVASQRTIARALDLLGVGAPEEM